MSGTLATHPAATARSFLDSIGLNTHLDFAWTAYADTAGVIAALNYLGVGNVRDSAGTDADVALWGRVAQATGVKFDAFIGETSPADMATQLARIPALAQAGLLDLIEGGNEEDDPYPASLGNSIQAASAFQQQVWTTGRALGLPVVNISFGLLQDYGATGDLSAWADYGNAHTYYGTGNNPGQPATWDGAFYPTTIGWLNQYAAKTTPGKPVIITESGYYTTGSATDPSSVSEAVQAKYALDILMDGFRSGAARTYLYELMDQKTGDGWSEDNFGLFHSDGSAKPAATAIHNLTTLLADPGAPPAGQAALPYALSGMPAGGNSLLLQKSDGTWWLALWNDTRLSGPLAPTDLAVAPVPVTLTLGQAAGLIQVFDPLTGTGAVQSAAGQSRITLLLPDHPVLVEIAGAGAGGSAKPPDETGGTAPPQPNPVVRAPGAAQTTSGTELAIAGVSVTDSWAAIHPGTLALNVTDGAGLLRMTDRNGSPVAGSGGDTIHLSGTLADLNAALATLRYTAAASPGLDTISVNVWDQAGVSATATVAVSVSAPIPDAPAPGPGTGGAPSLHGTVSVPGLRTDATIVVSAGSGTVVAAGSGVAVNAAETVAFDDGTLTYAPQSTVGTIWRLYEAATGSAPDPIGLGYWKEALESGQAGPPRLAQALLEANPQRLRESNADFVATLYRNALGRAADPAGLAYWQGRLDSGALGRADVMTSIAGSPEAVQHGAGPFLAGVWAPDSAAVMVEGLYRAVFGQLPDAGGLDYWTRLIEGGTTAQLVAASMIASPVFRQSLAAPGSPGFSATIIHNSFGVWDPAAEAYWDTRLASGAVSQADVAVAYATSPGLRETLTALVAHGAVHG